MPAPVVNQALEEGWRRAVRCAAADGSITHEEEFRLRRFRDRLGVNRSSAHAQATAQLNLTSRQRLLSLTQAAATTVEDGDRTFWNDSQKLSGKPGSARKHSPYRIGSNSRWCTRMDDTLVGDYSWDFYRRVNDH